MNKWKSELDKRGCDKIDQIATDKFINLSKERGWKVSKSSIYDDIMGHWDYEIKRDGIKYRVDVKGLKRINSHSAVDDSLILVELKNVNGGRGWLIGEADYIAFEIEEGLLMVKRDKLYQLVRSLIDISIMPVKSTKDKRKHIWYTRSQWGRYDKFVYLTKMEIVNIGQAIWRC